MATSSPPPCCRSTLEGRKNYYFASEVKDVLKQLGINSSPGNCCYTKDPKQYNKKKVAKYLIVNYKLTKWMIKC